MTGELCSFSPSDWDGDTELPIRRVGFGIEPYLFGSQSARPRCSQGTQANPTRATAQRSNSTNQFFNGLKYWG
jgi:hypothetical protein